MGEWGNGGIHGLQSWPCHYLCCPDGRCIVLSSFVLIFDIFQCNVWNEWGMRKTLITGNRKLSHKRFQGGRWGGKQRKNQPLLSVKKNPAKLFPLSLLFHSRKTLAEVGSDLSQHTLCDDNKTPCHGRDFWPIRPFLWLIFYSFYLLFFKLHINLGHLLDGWNSSFCRLRCFRDPNA